MKNNLFVRIKSQKAHDKFVTEAKSISTLYSTKIFFDMIDCTIWQNGVQYGFKKEQADFISNNLDKFKEILAEHDDVKGEYGSLKSALDTLFELNVWEDFKN